MEPLLGQIQEFAFDWAPRGWMKCEGQTLNVNDHTSLFSLIGTIYGNDGASTFKIPDLRSRAIVGVGTARGDDNNIELGNKGGQVLATLSTAQLPVHTHAVHIPVSRPAGAEASPNGQFIATSPNAFNADKTENIKLANFTSEASTGGQSFNQRNPYVGINMCISISGIFPERN